MNPVPDRRAGAQSRPAPWLRQVAPLLIVLLAGPAAAQAGEELLDRFLAWLPGEYDNHEQVWLDEQTEGRIPHDHWHQLLLPITAPGLGEHLFLLRQTDGATMTEVSRQYVLRTRAEGGGLRTEILEFTDGASWEAAHTQTNGFAALDTADVRAVSGCDIHWRWTGDAFAGATSAEDCRNGDGQIRSRSLAVTLTENTLEFLEEGFDADGERVLGREDQLAESYRKVRYFTGWASVRPGGMEDPSDDEWWFLPQFEIHTEGQIVPIVTPDGTETGYSVQLAQLTYQGRNPQPILKLGIIENETGKTLRYSWTNPDAIQTGINLRWMQTGLKQRPENEHFGLWYPPTPPEAGETP